MFVKMQFNFILNQIFGVINGKKQPPSSKTVEDWFN